MGLLKGPAGDKSLDRHILTKKKNDRQAKKRVMVHGDTLNGDTSELRDGAGQRATVSVQRSFG